MSDHNKHNTTQNESLEAMKKQLEEERLLRKITKNQAAVYKKTCEARARDNINFRRVVGGLLVFMFAALMLLFYLLSYFGFLKTTVPKPVRPVYSYSKNHTV